MVTTSMRSLTIYLVCGLLLSSCAYKGTVVRKEFRPLPFIDSLGLEGIYNFALRDRDGRIHSQMATADVSPATRSAPILTICNRRHTKSVYRPARSG